MEQKHSGLGIASFITSIAAGILIFAAVVIAGVMETSTPGGLDEKSASAMMVGLAIIALLIVELAALGLGIGGLCRSDSKKIFAILGTTFSAVTIAGTLLLMIIGLMAGE